MAKAHRSRQCPAGCEVHRVVAVRELVNKLFQWFNIGAALASLAIQNSHKSKGDVDADMRL
eukprot:5210125-Amphidinium_carterae.1